MLDAPQRDSEPLSALEEVLGTAVSEMVSAALEYAPQVDEVLIYFSNENGTRTADVAYVQNGTLLTKDHVEAPDTSSAMKRALLKFIVSQVGRIQASVDSAHPIPTAGRIRYAVATRSVDMDLTPTPELTDYQVSPSDKFQEWLQQVAP
ncbi:hypothetical protein F8O06_04740 [Pseudoclavibacter sp. CFCC 14310]|uniref:hypothetical protein n=1 Tax=Pseudoclavibacter sp. CFCC 14310 TaxID=2615180 RepID=UPI0013012B80|nr:hypothetical protein [Pseudoclavibacter sp. CFCC 14310]KAB1645467.1 hypothetical protein F8O06_07705 [Pseudoclavibacter sp. CFCC 14310]KAB1646074.1 hypothetical protein F8O06_04740 [Pseudoclavibacter sp. CFCC 14310]